MQGVLFGLLGGVLGVIGWIVIRLFLPLVWARLAATWSNAGGGGAGGYVDSISVLLAAVAGFIAGYWFGK